jgi:hypothetical protein
MSQNNTFRPYKAIVRYHDYKTLWKNYTQSQNAVVVYMTDSFFYYFCINVSLFIISAHHSPLYKPDGPNCCYIVGVIAPRLCALLCF